MPAYLRSDSRGVKRAYPMPDMRHVSEFYELSERERLAIAKDRCTCGGVGFAQHLSGCRALG